MCRSFSTKEIRPAPPVLSWVRFSMGVLYREAEGLYTYINGGVLAGGRQPAGLNKFYGKGKLMDLYDTQTTREMLKTRWPELNRDKTDSGRKMPPPPMQKKCGEKTTALPEAKEAAGQVSKGITLQEAIRNRESRRTFDPAPLSLQELSYLLWASQGIRKNNEKASFRTVPSGGARHPFETYIVVHRVEGLESGLYRYLPFDHALCAVREGAVKEDALEEAMLKHHFGAAVDFVWAAVPYRCEWKYAWESLRLILLDAGHLCGHLYLACEDIGCGTCAVGAYNQEKLDALIGVDGRNEFSVYAAPVGKLPKRES